MRFASALLLFAATSVQAAITGTLIDDTGAPIAGATVRAYAAEDSQTARLRMLSAEPNLPVLATVKSAENGTFRVDVKTPRARLSFEASGKRPAHIETPDGAELNLLVLRSGPARLLKLSDSTKAVANAMVFSGPFTLKSDAEGRVELPDALGAGGYSYIVHPDFAPMINFARGDDSMVVLEQRLSKGVAIRGRVLSADGKPVAGATIAVDGWPLALSVADGTFQVLRAPASWRSLVATADTRMRSVARESAKTLDLTLKPAGSISGTSSPGVRITLGDIERDTSVIADAAGKFASPALPMGRYILIPFRSRSIAGSAVNVSLAEGARVTKAVPADPVTLLRGRVVDEAGKAVENAFVFVRGGFGRDVVRTNANGEFAAPRAMRGPQSLVALKSGYAAGLAPNVGDDAKDIKITLPRGFPLQVRVVDRRQQPVEGVWLFAGAGAPPDGFHEVACETAVLSSDCRFTTKDGVVTLRTTEDEHQLTAYGASVARLSRRESITAKSSPLTFVVDAPAEVSGFVRFTDGTPVTNATVVVPGMGLTRANEDGSFVMRSLPAGPVQLTAMLEGRTTFRAEVEANAPAKNVIISLPNPSRIEGRVTEREGGRPVTEFQVSYNAIGRGSSTGTPVQSENGAFALDFVPAGSMSVVVTAPGYTRATLSNIVVEEGKTTSNVDFQLDKGGSVRGRVTSKGQPVAGVMIGGGDRFGPSIERSDENGEYFVDNLAPGEQVLRFNKEGFVVKRKSVEVARGKETRLDVELDAGLEVHGSVVDKTGKPVAGARITVQSNSEGSGPGLNVSDASGNFRVRGLEEGRYRVAARKEGFTEAIEEVTVPVTAPVTLTVDSGGTITGRVSGLTGTANVRVFASGPGTNTSTNVNADGGFTLRGVSDGRVSVTAMSGGRGDKRAGPKYIEVNGGTAPFVELDFSEGFVVSGRVTRAGVPVTTGNVSFQPQGAPGRSAQINSDGTYEISGLSAGEHRVNIFSSSGPMFTGRFTVASNTTYDIRIEGATIRGRVIDSATSMPVSDVNVFITPSRENPVGRSAASDSEGRFTLEAVPSGTYELRATSRQSYAPSLTPVTIAGEGVQDVEVRLTRAQPTTFRITDATTGAPVDASIVVTDGSKMITRVQGRDDDGAIRVYVAPGSYKATVTARAYVPSTAQFTVPGPEVRVQLSSGGRLMLTASKRVRVRVTGGPRPYNTFASPSGTPVEGIAPGNYTVEVLSEDGKSVLRTHPVVVIAGQTATVNVE